MKRFFVFSTLLLACLLVANVSNAVEPNIWRKFKGEAVPAGVPDLIDWSYAGYKNGSESISNHPDLPVYNVRDFGAIPNDNGSDTVAIRATLVAARSGGVVFFPPGQYDVYLAGEEMESFMIEGDNIIVRGSGAIGVNDGGTTIKMHNHFSEDWGPGMFKSSWRENGSGSETSISGTFPRGTMFFDVVDASSLLNRRFIKIYADDLMGEDWAKHSSRPLAEMGDGFTDVLDGIDIFEMHEIDRIEGNRVYIKAPTMTPLNSNYSVFWQDLSVNIGIEDLHIEGDLNEKYMHNPETSGRNAITLTYTAHSWVRRCRLTSTTHPVRLYSAYANSVLLVKTDGWGGHYPVVIVASTYCLAGLIDDNTDIGASHGISVATRISRHRHLEIRWH